LNIENNWNIHNYKSESLEKESERGRLKNESDKRMAFYDSILAAKGSVNLRKH